MIKALWRKIKASCLRWRIFERPLALYVLLGLVSLVLVRWPQLVERYQVKVLNELRPTFSNLVQFSKNPSMGKHKELAPYFRYFHQVNDFVEVEPMSLLMLGYLHGYAGDFDKSETYFFRAAHLRPRFLWPAYNLGVIRAVQGKYAEAINILEHAIGLDAEESRRMMYDAIVYRQIIHGSAGFDFILKDDLVAGQIKVYQLLITAYIASGDPKTANHILDYVLSQRAEVVLPQTFIYFVQGALLYKEEQWQKAFYLLNLAIKDEKEMPAQTYAMLADVLIHLGEKERGNLLKKYAVTLKKDAQYFLNQFPLMIF